MTALRSGLLALPLLLLIAPVALAQGTSSSGAAAASSTSSSRTTGSTSSGTTSQSGSTTSGSATGAGSAGGGASGNGDGTLEQPSFTQFGQAASQSQGGFVGRGNNTQTFVGASAAGQQSVDAGGTARFSGMGGGGGGTGGGGSSTSQARGGQMRVPQRIAFTVPPLAPAALMANLQSQFSSLQQRVPGVSVATTEPGHVVLRGTVESEHAKKLAEAVARLEPGVRKITNELQVSAAANGTTRPLLP